MISACCGLARLAESLENDYFPGGKQMLSAHEKSKISADGVTR